MILYLYYEDRISCSINISKKTFASLSVCSLNDAVVDLIDTLPSWLKDGLVSYELVLKGNLKNETEDLFN